MTPILIATLALLVVPSTGHRLITNPYPEQQYDSVIVSSDSITIRDRRQNETTPLKSSQILKPQKRSYEECPQNDFACLYRDDKANNHIVDKFLEQYSNSADVKYERDFTDKGNLRKPHWTKNEPETQHRIRDDSKGWVTLDPVPWSTSKISKWHPHKPVSPQAIHGHAPQLPAEQFWVSGSNLHEQKPSSQWGIGTNDIITDHRPSDFPLPHHGYGSPHQHPFQGVNAPQQENFYGSQGSFNDFHRQPPKGAPFANPQSAHPSTYPSNGNGEWILLSSTKGYSHPQRHRWGGAKDLKAELSAHSSRSMKPVDISRYHEESLSDRFNLRMNRKSDETGDASNSTGAGNEKALQILYTGSNKNEEATTTTRRKVRLQVLPALENSSTLHEGLLEVDSSPQTVDDAQEEDEKLKNLNGIPGVKKNKIRGYKLVPALKFRGKSSSHKNMMTLAAVGAGMIPASMALLVPMALGRRKRSSPQIQPLEKFPFGGE